MALSWLSWMWPEWSSGKKIHLGPWGLLFWVVGVGLVGAGEFIGVDSAFDSNTSNPQFFEANMIPA